MGYTKAQRAAKLKAQENAEKKEVKLSEPVVVKEEKPEVKKKTTLRNIPLSTNVWVVSNCYGELLYKSKSGYLIRWPNFRSKQPMSLEELLAMRNIQHAFFENNWIMISGFVEPEYEDKFSVEEILEFLQVKELYSSVLCPEDIEAVFSMSAEDIEKRVPNMSAGVKNAILIRANDLIQNGKLDSLKVMKALQSALGCDLSVPK